MDPLTLLAIGSAISSIIGRTLERPKRPSTDWANIQRNLEAGIQRRISGEATGAQQQAGQIAASRGLTGGAAAQVVAQSGAPVRAAGEAEMMRIGADIMRAQGQERDAYNQRKSEWGAGMLGDVAEGLGGLAGMLAQRKNLEAIYEILSGAKKTQQNAKKTGTSIGLQPRYELSSTGVRAQGQAEPNVGGQNGMSGGNFTPLRNDWEYGQQFRPNLQPEGWNNASY